MTRGKILVVLPTLGDRIDFLEETLATVAQQRTQVDLTLVVILPERAEEARALAARFGAVVLDDPGRGISEAINVGVRAATDEVYYAWIGDDDLFRDGGLRILRDLLDADPTAVVAYGGCDYVDPQGRTIGTSRAGRAALWLLPWGPRPHPAPRLDHPARCAARDRTLRPLAQVRHGPRRVPVVAPPRPVPLDPHERVGLPLASRLAHGGQPGGIQPGGP